MTLDEAQRTIAVIRAIPALSDVCDLVDANVMMCIDQTGDPVGYNRNMVDTLGARLTDEVWPHFVAYRAALWAFSGFAFLEVSIVTTNLENGLPFAIAYFEKAPAAIPTKERILQTVAEYCRDYGCELSYVSHSFKPIQ